MSTYIELLAGAASKDDAFGPTEDVGSLVFPADGVEHSCGWTKYIPPVINAKTTVTLNTNFLDDGVGAGTARVDFTWYGISSAGVIVDSGGITQLVAIPNVANTVVPVAIDITALFASNPELLFLRMARDSSLAGDAFAHPLRFAEAYTQ